MIRAGGHLVQYRVGVEGPLGMLPQEFVSKRVIPLVRGYIALCLQLRGMSQHRIARILGVSQVMVHKYSKTNLDYYLIKLEELGVPKGVSKLILEEVCDNPSDSGYIVAIVANKLALESNYCRNHSSWCNQVLCSVTTLVEEAYRIVLNKILSLPGLYKIIPEVGSNLAYSPRNAKNIDEVLGLDGRIIKVKPNKVMAVGKPVPGGSTHTGSIALKYSKVWSRDAWAFAIKLDEEGKLPKLEGIAIEVESGVGREPVAYLVSSDPDLLVKAIMEFVHRLSLKSS